MATVLTKDLVRVSTERVNDKEIIVTLTSGQEIELKLKGKRDKGETIYIRDLYSQLYGIDNSNKGSLSIKSNLPRKRGDNKMISLYDLRSHSAISTLSFEDRAKFDQIIKSVIDSYV